MRVSYNIICILIYLHYDNNSEYDKMAKANNPYGDGSSAEIIYTEINDNFKKGIKIV